SSSPHSSFFFYSYVVHRDLHSFPTRRSSDLVRNVAAVFLEQVDDVVALEGADPAFLGFFEGVLAGRQIARGAHARGIADHVGKVDRKSTRLTSHVAISYAVFCLKKKKKNINI